MASKNTENTIAGDKLIIEELSNHLEYTKKERKFLLELSFNGAIAVETMLEYAISVVGDIPRSNADGEDFVDGSDAKKATVYNTGKSRTCWVGNVKKNGILRVMVADAVANEIFYFKIPQWVVGMFNNRRDFLSFTFNPKGGMPDKLHVGKASYIIWTDCRVNTFKELCE